MAYEHRYPVVLVCSGSFNPVTTAHIKMFEIARSFLERNGRHIVIGGVMSPITSSLSSHGGAADEEMLCESHRATMCRIAVQRHSWLTVDTWQSSQIDEVKPLKLLRRITNKLRNEYGAPSPYNQHMEYWSNHRSRFPTTAVRLQPDGSLRNQVIGPSRQPSPRSLYDVTYTSSTSSASDDNNQQQQQQHEMMRKAEMSKAGGELMNLLGGQLQRVCCVQPPTFNYQNDNLAFGATYDLRRTKVMLLCGADTLEKFGDQDEWSDEEIREIVECFGLVCIPRNYRGDDRGQIDNRADCMRKAFDRLQLILSDQPGTVILVNDHRRSEISKISSKTCRNALKKDAYDVTSGMLDPAVLDYINKYLLYQHSNNTTSSVMTSSTDNNCSNQSQVDDENDDDDDDNDVDCGDVTTPSTDFHRVRRKSCV